MRLDLHKLTNVKLLKVHKKKEKKLKPKKCKSRSDKAGRRGKFGIMSRLILITLGPAVILAIILGVFSLNILTEGMRRQAYDGLESVAESVAAAYNTADSGPY